MDLQVAVSTCAFPGRSVRQIDLLALANDLTMEFSSGFHYEPDLGRKFISAHCRRLIHNYFPPPRQPFVLNLASLDDSGWERSIDHGRKGIRLAHYVSASFYSIHAGFCFDPQPNELGHSLTHYVLRQDRQRYWRRFLRAIDILLCDAASLGIDLLIENNVVSRENKKVPLLCSDIRETARLFKENPHERLGLLLDTGHLKVSAKTLGFSANTFVDTLGKHIKALHHSDNDAISDTNLPLKSNYWFLKFMSRFAKTLHILEVCDVSIKDIRRQSLLLQKAAGVSQVGNPQ